MNILRSNLVRVVTLLAVLFAGLLSANQVHAHGKAGSEALAFQDAMRKLWEDHITWTRLYIVSVVSDLPDQDPTAQRLLQNQVDIGNAIQPFYGEDAGSQLSLLLKDHILIAAELLEAAKSGDTAAFEAASESWYSNANDIASFLNAANPKQWPLDEMKVMMTEHLDLTLLEASARLNGDWENDIAAYDAIHDQILEMADMLSAGIIAQFPNKFK